MPNVLKAIAARLKNRKRFPSWSRRLHSATLEDAAPSEPPAEHMADLTLDSPVDPSKTALPGPYIFGDKTFEFDFAFLSTCNPWPGPAYDKDSPFAPGVFDTPRLPKRRLRFQSPNVGKRKLSQDDRSASHKRDKYLHPRLPAKPTGREMTTTRALSYFGPSSNRQPPLHLLDLPGEIRNQIYRLLYLKDDPLFAQFRRIMKPKSGGAKSLLSATILRRFPREPMLALVCRQLQDEVLSLFYGENKFIFQQSERPDRVAQHGIPQMIDPHGICHWVPKFGYGKTLKYVEVHFKARSSGMKQITITYTFCKDSEGSISVSSNAKDIGHCTCLEGRALCKYKEEQYGRSVTGIVPEVQVFLMTRQGVKSDDACRLIDGRNQPSKCGGCGLERLREMHKLL